jgi:hypothetical protein
MANILVLVPIKPGLQPALIERASVLLETQTGLETWLRICPEKGDGRPYSAHAEARNAMLDMYLKPEHTHVLWIDADVVEYPPDLATRLHAVDPDAIVAPLPLIEGTRRFYDVAGFVDTEGQHASPYHPYFRQWAGTRTVGTCYLAPAALLRTARYAPTPGHTEHYSVCRHAQKVTVAEDVLIYHADLPRWGEQWH